MGSILLARMVRIRQHATGAFDVTHLRGKRRATARHDFVSASPSAIAWPPAGAAIRAMRHLFKIPQRSSAVKVASTQVHNTRIAMGRAGEREAPGIVTRPNPSAQSKPPALNGGDPARPAFDAGSAPDSLKPSRLCPHFINMPASVRPLPARDRTEVWKHPIFVANDVTPLHIKGNPSFPARHCRLSPSVVRPARGDEG
jgi:hypothetical protein